MNARREKYPTAQAGERYPYSFDWRLMMKTSIVALIINIAVVSTPGLAIAAGPVIDSSLGLSKTSVFDDPAPELFEYIDTRARKSKSMPRAFPGAPPQIPHEVESMLPITMDDNQCLECHDRPEKIGAETVKGGYPMDKNHYSAHGEMNATAGWKISGSRYTCNQCHVPQAEVAPLVINTF